MTIQPISLENGLAHMASLPSVRAKVLGSSTGKTRRWVKSISLLKGVKNTVEPRTCDVVSPHVGLRRETELPQGRSPSSIQASFLVEGKSKCLTDKLGRDFEMLVSNCREGKVLSDINNKNRKETYAGYIWSLVTG